MKGLAFDESGYQIDHIVELRHGGSNDTSNLQALCPACHSVKTSRNYNPPPAIQVPEPKKNNDAVQNVVKHIYRDVLVAGRILQILKNASTANL